MLRGTNEHEQGRGAKFGDGAEGRGVVVLGRGKIQVSQKSCGAVRRGSEQERASAGRRESTSERERGLVMAVGGVRGVWTGREKEPASRRAVREGTIRK